MAMETKHHELRKAVERIPLVDAHAHNLVSIDSSFPFLRCFSEAEDEALDLTPHSLPFKVLIIIIIIIILFYSLSLKLRRSI
ncbi:hypothetical protein DsansV1_C22g0172571 [Dioscorea sansibarensis]